MLSSGQHQEQFSIAHPPAMRGSGPGRRGGSRGTAAAVGALWHGKAALLLVHTNQGISAIILVAKSAAWGRRVQNVNRVYKTISFFYLIFFLVSLTKQMLF